jgi:hypothetical protein
MSEAKEAIREASSAKVIPPKQQPAPTKAAEKSEALDYRRAVDSVNRASDAEMDRALAGYGR